jgi:hypothetical protein
VKKLKTFVEKKGQLFKQSAGSSQINCAKRDASPLFVIIDRNNYSSIKVA